MPKKGILSGPKINNKHSSFIPLAGSIIEALKPHPQVKKIVLGPIKVIGNGKRRITVRSDKGQTRIQCRDHTSVQILWVIGIAAEKVEEILKNILG